MEYTVVSENILIEFIKEVNRKIEEDWVVSGELSTCYDGAYCKVTYSQVLTRY